MTSLKHFKGSILLICILIMFMGLIIIVFPFPFSLMAIGVGGPLYVLIQLMRQRTNRGNCLE